MKLIKKIAAIMFAFMMVVSMSCNVKADEGTSTDTTGTLTINYVKENQTYKLYKILDLESFSGQNYSYKVAEGWEKFFSTGEGKNYININENNYAEWNATKDDATYRVFAQKALEYANNTETITPVKTYTTSTGQTTITETGLALGYYLLDSSVGTLCSLSSSQPNVTIDEKNDVPSVQKSFADGETKNNANIGDIITFNTVVNVKKGAQSYVLHDKMSAGLKLNKKLNADNDKPVLITKDNHEKLIYGTDYTFTETTDGFTIDFSEAFLKRFEDKEYALIVMYSATLTEEAVIGGTGNTNETYLKYGVSSESNHSTTTTYTFGIPVLKYTGIEKTPLAGAKFKLYTDSNCNDESTALKFSLNNNNKYRYDSTNGKTVLTSLETTGRIDIEGLEAGTYYLKEIEAPKGYNLLANAVEVQITQDGKVMVKKGANLEEVTEVEVENKTGTVLPSTGGVGTTMIYLVGAVLVLGSGVVLVTKRRVKNK